MPLSPPLSLKNGKVEAKNKKRDRPITVGEGGHK